MLFSSDDQPSLGYHFRVDFIFPLPNRTIETKFREVSGMDRTIVMETDSVGENKVPFLLLYLLITEHLASKEECSQVHI